MARTRTRWVRLAYRLRREPSTPRIALWRALRRLGAAQVVDGLAALPLDARNREQLESLARAWSTRTERPPCGSASCARPVRSGISRYAWLVRRFLDPEAEFGVVDDPAEVPTDATPFDMLGAELSHHGGDGSFETFLRRWELADPLLRTIGQIVHEADLADERFDAPEAPGLDVLLRGLSMVRDDDQLLELSAPLSDGLYGYRRRALATGRRPA